MDACHAAVAGLVNLVADGMRLRCCWPTRAMRRRKCRRTMLGQQRCGVLHCVAIMQQRESKRLEMWNAAQVRESKCGDLWDAQHGATVKARTLITLYNHTRRLMPRFVIISVTPLLWSLAGLPSASLQSGSTRTHSVLSIPQVVVETKCPNKAADNTSDSLSVSDSIKHELRI